ncbi:MAG: hypothetical protein IJZ55_04580 [Lachnospiraceae bacterium]|nr:hypothetical protein [Lachnospiraceae bacterium]
MLKNKYGTSALLALTICVFLGACSNTAPTGANGAETGETVTGGLTIQKEKTSESLYTKALEESTESTQKYTTVRRGDFVNEVNVAGEVIYPKQKTVRYDFPYGATYYMEAINIEKPNKIAGEPIASIHVQMDEIQLAVMERQLQRMEERGETGTAYEELKAELEAMQKALETREIVMEEDGILLEQEHLRFGSKISSYTIVVADPKERLIQVPNENNQFRYGQKVKVSAKINGVTTTGTGTVITASASTISEDLAGTTAYIRLDEDSEMLYDGSNITATAEIVHMKDVLLLNASATYMANGMQMVKVKDEYGLHAVSFSFGRKNETTYWVIDGLEEGAQILVQ